MQGHADHPGSRAYIVEGSKHVWTTQSPRTVMSEGVALSDWLEQFLDPDSEWESVIPASLTQ